MFAILMAAGCSDSGSSECQEASCEPETIATGPISPALLAVDARSVYWTAGTIEGGNDGTVMKVGVDGGDPVTLASDQPYPRDVAVDAESVYWTNNCWRTRDLAVEGLDSASDAPVG